MDLALLDVFRDVLRSGSFAAAARGRNVDPSAVSRQIAALERELGFALFDRTTRRLAPTEAGRVYGERIAGVLEELDLARERGRDAMENLAGELRVGASVAFGERWLVPRLASFRARHPRLTLDLRLSDAVVDIAAEGIDVALRLGPRVEGAFVASRLMDTNYRVVAAPSYLARRGRPSSPQALREHDCLAFALPGYRSRWRFRGADGRSETVDVRAGLVASNALALRRAALDGMGVALLADWTIDADVADGTLVDLFARHRASAAENTAAWIVYPSRRYVPAKTRALIDHLKASRAGPEASRAM